MGGAARGCVLASDAFEISSEPGAAPPTAPSRYVAVPFESLDIQSPVMPIESYVS